MSDSLCYASYNIIYRLTTYQGIRSVDAYIHENTFRSFVICWKRHRICLVRDEPSVFPNKKCFSIFLFLTCFSTYLMIYCFVITCLCKKCLFISQDGLAPCQGTSSTRTRNRNKLVVWHSMRMSLNIAWGDFFSVIHSAEFHWMLLPWVMLSCWP